VLPRTALLPPVGTLVDPGALASLRTAHPVALAVPRQLARFLCGLTSPAASREKLTRDPLFGVLAEHRFAAVLEWCEQF
jgi:ATP-dependent DNA helicase RecQ